MKYKCIGILVISQTRSAPRNSRTDVKTHIPLKILVVEDTRSLSMLLAAQIEQRWGAPVIIARSYKEAQQALESTPNFFVALCDLNLPDAPDGEVIDLIVEAGVKVIALTGSFGDELRDRMAKKGVVDYILKKNLNSYSYAVELIGRLYLNLTTDVLIVRDGSQSSVGIESTLRHYNYRVSSVGTGADALQLLDESPTIRLLISDYQLPDMDGLELTVKARESQNKSSLAIIGIDADGNSDVGTQFLKNGANDFLLMPFTGEELISRVNQCMDVLEYIEEIHNLANRDHLTGTYNRRFFFVEGESRLSALLKDKAPGTVAMLDIDHFKQVNDTYGHEAGDEVLIAFAHALEAEFSRSTDLIARLGGEEFAVLVAESSSSVIERLERLRERVESLEIVAASGDTVKVTVSIGVNLAPENCMDTSLKVADEKLYQAKDGGRNRVVT